jgi:hypothetical protein
LMLFEAIVVSAPWLQSSLRSTKLVLSHRGAGNTAVAVSSNHSSQQ